MEWTPTLELPQLTRTLHLSGCHFGAESPGWSYPRHHHYLFELLNCREGEVAQDIGEERFSLTSGQWLLIRSGVPHATANTAGVPYVYFNLHFDFDDPALREGLCRSPYLLLSAEEAESLGLQEHAEAIERALGAGGGVGVSASAGTAGAGPGKGAGIRAGSGESAGIGAHASPGTGAGPDIRSGARLAYEDPLQASVNRLRIQSHALELVARIAEFVLVAPAESSRQLPDGGDASTVGSATLAHAIEEQLREGLREGRTIGQIASTLGVSPGRCAKAFSEVYGQPPRQYLSRLVLNEAKRLLLSTPKSVGEIAEELHFESASHFSRQFRRWTGMSPSAYRPKHLR